MLGTGFFCLKLFQGESYFSLTCVYGFKKFSGDGENVNDLFQELNNSFKQI